MEKVRIGIVGSKFAADFHADCYSRNNMAELTAVAAIDNLEEYSKKWNIKHVYEDYNKMLERDDLDVISVCVPNFLHHPVALAAAKAGKDIICEKPLATKIEHAEEIIKVCDDSGVKLMYAEDWIFSPPLKRVKAVLDEGAIGDILYVKGKECHNGTHSPFAKKKETCGGGSFIHLGIHPIGYFLYLLGDGGKNPVVEVTGFVNGGQADNYVHKDNGGEDFGAGMMKFKNGQRAFVEGNYITVGGMDDKVEYYGKEGLIKVDLTHKSNVQVYSRSGYSYGIEKEDNTVGWSRPAVDEFWGLGYVPELEYFIRCVAGEEKLFYGVDGKAGLACLKIISAFYESAEKKCTIEGEWA
ncbi:MAG: Gfo/Idh/MocA family oxidoreductase [bacterium]